MNRSLTIALGCLLPIVGWTQRPMIWVRADERAQIIGRIEQHQNLRTYYCDFKKRVGEELDRHESDPAAYLRELPFDFAARETGKMAPLKTFNSFSGEENAQQDQMQLRLHAAIDCAVLYWLTREVRYARYAADILHAFIGGLLPVEPSFANSNGGWIYPNDHLREAREIGAQLPLIYDFIYDYLLEDGTVFDLGTGGEVKFNQEGAQTVFRTYARLAVEQGIIDCNWPILEMPSLLHNALALDDPVEREHYLQYVTRESTDHQDALPKIGAFYARHGGTWPESFNYAQHVSQNLTYVLTLFKHHDPSRRLLDQYPSFVAALPQARYFTYPDGEQTILFGDGHRPYHPLRDGLEMAYHLASQYQRSDLQKAFAALLMSEVENGGYARFELPRRSFGASIYREPVTLLWYEPEVNAPAGEYPLPVTDELPFAGITLQRNVSPTGDPRDALMYFVGGAAFVHGHASGMNMEVYGKGEVLGAKSGRSSYRSDVHENYYRLFASHNTVVVNGASRGEGDWVNLGTETVKREVAEPAPGAAPVSTRHAFSANSFLDTRGDEAEARQQRTVAMVRTSDTTGYYVDIYRSVSELPDQYHDYIYHNIGEQLALHSALANATLPLTDTPERYAASAGQPWTNNRAFRNPGWHFFDEVRTAAAFPEDVVASFTTAAPDGPPVSMRVHLPGGEGRSYTTVMAPPSTESPAPYNNLPTPTLVVRKEGEAWDEPFIAVLEPGEAEVDSKLTVRRIGAGDAGAASCGIAVQRGSAATRQTQYILSLDGPDGHFVNAETDLDFRGRFAIVELNHDGQLKGIYIGQGQALTFRNTTVSFAAGVTGSAYIDVSASVPVIQSASPLRITTGGSTTDYQPEN